MKFSIKVFLATIIVVVLSFTMGGYLLVNSLFQSALEREINAAMDENKMLRFSLETALSGISEPRGEVLLSVISDLAENMLAGPSASGTSIRVSDSQYGSIYSSETITLENSTLRNVQEDERGYVIHHLDSGYYIQTFCMVFGAEEMLYLESIRDISSIFSERDAGFKTMQRTLILLIFVDGILVYLISKVLTLPIRRLSRGTRRLADGNMGYRVEIESKDEIGMLASDFNRMADEIELRIQELKDANRRQEDFVASFAHELKTPLTSMIGYADMLRSKSLEPEDQFLAAGYIFSEGKRLESLSLKLLDLIVLRKQDFEMKKVSAERIFADVDAFFVPTLRAGITLEVSAEKAMLFVEPDLFKTLLINLVDNARKAIDQTGHIWLTGRVEDGGYGIYVRDTGRGIPPEDLSRITEPFYMVDKSRAREKGGSGLGLAICAEIVSLHKGVIEFESFQGQGTEVYVFLGEKPYEESMEEL